MWKRILLLCVASSLINSNGEASTIRSSFMDNINNGLKMLGKNDRRLFVSHQSYYSRYPSGVSDKIADLVSQSFAPARPNGKRNSNRQDSVMIGDVSPPQDNHIMGGMLKLLGFDGAKMGAVAVNGIIFIAQMVRYGASRFVDYMMTKTWDWYKIVDYIGERMKNETIDGEVGGVAPLRVVPVRVRFN